jgi:hypothetical protein
MQLLAWLKACFKNSETTRILIDLDHADGLHLGDRFLERTVTFCSMAFARPGRHIGPVKLSQLLSASVDARNREIVAVHPISKHELPSTHCVLVSRSGNQAAWTFANYPCQGPAQASFVMHKTPDGSKLLLTISRHRGIAWLESRHDASFY